MVVIVVTEALVVVVGIMMGIVVVMVEKGAFVFLAFVATTKGK